MKFQIKHYLFVLGGICMLFLGHHFLSRDNKIGKDELGISKLYPSEDFFLLKQYPENKFYINAYEKAIKSVQNFAKSFSNRSGGDWVTQGPGNIGARANTIAVDPKNPLNMLIGYSEGGLFKTSDGGVSWKPVFDEQLRLSIGDVVYDPNNTDIAYAGTGDPNVSGFPFIGDGIYKSTDGGDTWRNMGLRETRVISQIRVSNQNSNIIYVSAMGLPFEKNQHRGVYKTINGGQSWEQVLFVNDSTGIADIVIHPTNHNIIYATGWNRIRNNFKSIVSGPDARIFKSIDGGRNWEILRNGLPENASSRIGIDISITNPNILYACYAEAGNFNLKGIYKTTDGGDNWESLEINENAGLSPGVYSGFGWYFGKIRINPKDPNDVFLLGVDLYRTKNGGISWESAAPPWWTYEVHADKHDLVFSNDDIYLTTDGGAYKKELNSELWEDIENIPTTQFYRVAYNPHQPNKYYGGAQDNGTSGGNSSAIDQWERIYGGDGFQPIFHPLDSNLFYVETQDGGLAVTTDGGFFFEGATFGIEGSEPTNWDMPIVMSSQNPDVLYTGTNRIYVNRTGASVEWTPISPDLTDPTSGFLRHNISALHTSPLDSNLVMAGTSDGMLWLTNDQGASWTNVGQGLPRKYVSSVSFSPTDRNVIYVSYTGYKDNDNTPYIYKSSNLGNSWISVQGNMPDIAINNILSLPLNISRSDMLVVATDAGVFYSKNSRDWFRMGNNMPLVTVYDVDYNEKNNQLIAGTFGRSIQTFDLDQINYPETVSTSFVDLYSALQLVPSIVTEGETIKIIYNGELSKVKHLVISDIYGKVRKEVVLSGKNLDLDVGGFGTGVYLISEKGKKTKAIKFIKI